MAILFYLSAVVAVIATVMVILEQNPVHALLYLIMSLLSTAVIFFLLGAPFGAALEVILYAGAIMVLFVFVVMMIDPGAQPGKRSARAWFGPLLLAAVLLVELVYILRVGAPATLREVGPQEVGQALFGPYILGVELASMLLLSALIGACHLGRGYRSEPGERPVIAGETKKDLLPLRAARPSKEL